MKQTFCKTCCGVKTVKVDGKLIPPAQWIKYGLASDVGCVCPSKRSSKK